MVFDLGYNSGKNLRSVLYILTSNFIKKASQHRVPNCQFGKFLRLYCDLSGGDNRRTMTTVRTYDYVIGLAQYTVDSRYSTQHTYSSQTYIKKGIHS